MSDLKLMVLAAREALKKEQPNTAEIFYRLIIRDTTPPVSGLARVAHGEACAYFARLELAYSKYGTAADWYRQAINADPRAIDYIVDFCTKCLVPMGLFKEARFEAERATKIEPDNPAGWRTLAGIEHKLGNVEESIAAYDKHSELAADKVNAALDRSTIALDTADYDNVKKLVTPLLETNRKGDACHVLAMANYREGFHEKAIELYDLAIENKCFDVPLAHWNKSLSLHSIGRYKEGWAAHEYRGKQKIDRTMAFIMNRFDNPIWDGKSRAETEPTKLHIHQEMGSGDCLVMSRYAPILADLGYDVRMEINDSFVSLFQRSFPNVNVMAKAVNYPQAMGIPGFDYHIPMMSLPHLMGTDIDSVPWSGPYLKPDPELVEQYRHKIGTGRIGLCWSSGIRYDGIWMTEYGKRNSMRFDQLRLLFPIGGPIGRSPFVSLQVGPELAEWPWAYGNVLPKKPTWDDTAALIANLDLVITVDTAVAHLAGAMGKPVWLMMQKDGSSWHWMCERPNASWNTKSPWYPSVRIFRQHEFNKPHYWDDVVADVAKALNQESIQIAAE